MNSEYDFRNFLAGEADSPFPGASILVAPEIALAAVAAALAFFTQMVGASVLRAIRANLGGGFVADAAKEDYSVGHKSGSFSISWVPVWARPGSTPIA